MSSIVMFSGVVPSTLSREPVVCLREERHDDVPNGRVARVEDRDPELTRIDGVGEDSIERRVIRVGHRADEPLERFSADADVQAKDAGPRQARRRAFIVLVGGDDRREVRKCFSGSSEKKVAPRAWTTSASG